MLIKMSCVRQHCLAFLSPTLYIYIYIFGIIILKKKTLVFEISRLTWLCLGFHGTQFKKTIKVFDKILRSVIAFHRR